MFYSIIGFQKILFKQSKNAIIIKSTTTIVPKIETAKRLLKNQEKNKKESLISFSC